MILHFFLRIIILSLQTVQSVFVLKKCKIDKLTSEQITFLASLASLSGYTLFSNNDGLK